MEDRGLEISQEKGVESSFSEQVELRKLEMNFEERQKEREFEERKMIREIDLRKMELEHRIGLAACQPTFDVSKHIRFVPPFHEKEVDIFFAFRKNC